MAAILVFPKQSGESFQQENYFFFYKEKFLCLRTPTNLVPRLSLFCPLVVNGINDKGGKRFMGLLVNIFAFANHYRDTSRGQVAATEFCRCD